MNKILELLKRETVEVIGCTEPAAIAYSFSAIKKIYPKLKIDPQKIQAQISASSFILRNAVTAGIPYLEIRGIEAIAAMGIFSENPQFNIFSKITKTQLANVNLLLKRKNWLVKKSLNKNEFYIKSELKINDSFFEVIIKDTHSNIISIKENGKQLFKSTTDSSVNFKSFDQIYNIAQKRDAGIEDFIKNILMINGKLFDQLKIKDLSFGVSKLIEYRMSGKQLSICTFTGSGNQGLFLSIPFYKLYKELGDKILPAFVFALLTQIYLTQKKGRLSKYCGLSEKVSPALMAGLLFLENKKIPAIIKAVEYILETTRGLLCEGATESCADKGYMCMQNVFSILKRLKD